MTNLAFEANLPTVRKSSRLTPVAKCWLWSTTALCAVSVLARPAMAEPTGGTVVGGDGAISQVGTVTTVDQTTQKLSLTWTSLDVGQAESLVFNQPNADAIALNRVLSNLPTEFLGNLTANGNIWIINPNGIAFGPNSVIDVGGLVATTIDIPDAEFWAENFSFSALTGSTVEYSKVTADGTILAGKGGVVLVAPVVEASGLITTHGGDVAIATARAFRVDFDGDGLLSFTVEAGAEGVLQLTDSSVISAQGGAVYLSAGAADAVTESVVNVGGLVESTQVEQRGGEIILSGGLGGEVIVTAELSAPGGAGQTGGSIDIFGDAITLASGASLDVSGAAGGGSIRVGGDYQGGGDAPTAKTTWVTADAMLNADATVDGDGGRVIVWSDQSTVFQGSLSAVGAGSGDGGFAEISGKENLAFAGSVDLSAALGDWGTLLFDPTNITIVAGTGADDSQIADGQVNSGDGGTASFVIGAATLDSIDADIILSASGDISVNADLSLTQASGDTDLTLNAGGDIIVSQSVTISTDGFIAFNATDSIILNASVTVSNDDNNSNPNIGFTAGDQILIGADASITADGNLTFVAGGGSDDNAAIVFAANSSLTSSNGLISISSTGGSDPDNNSILFGGGFDMSADTSISVTSGDQIIFGAVLDGSGTQVYSDGSISVDSASGATFSAGLDLIFLSDPESTASATVVGVTGSVLFTVTGSSDGNDIVFEDDASFTVSGGQATFDTTGNGDIEIQQDASIQGGTSGSLNFVSDDQVQIGASVTISTADDDITIQGGQAFVGSDTIVLSAGDDLIFFTSTITVTFNASGAITLAAGDDIIVDNNITLTGAPSVLFDAGGDFSFDHSGTNTISSAANLTIQSGADINIGDDEVISGSGSVALDAGDDVNILLDANLSASTTLLIEATDDMTFGTGGGSDDDVTLSAGGGTTLRAGSTLTLVANGDTNLHVTGSLTIDVAEISFGTGSTINAGTATVTFSSVSDGVITIDGGTTGLNVSAADLDKITAGEIAFVTGGDIDVVSLSFNDADVLSLTAGDDITFDGDSTITADLVVAASDAVTINANAALNVTGAATIDAGGDLTIDNNATIESNNDLTITSDDIIFGNTNSTIDVGSHDLFLVNADTDAMTIGSATAATDDWDITSADFDQITAGTVEFQTAGDFNVDGFSQASGASTIEVRASGSVTFVGGALSEFNEDATFIAGDGDGTGSVVFEDLMGLDQPSGALVFYGESITQGSTGFDSSGTMAFYAGDGSGTFTGDVLLTAGNIFTNPVDAQGDMVEIHATGTLPIGLVEANDAIFDADAYGIDSSTATTFVDVGTGTATLFFGTATVTVSDTGASDALDLASVDEDDFGFVNVGAAVGVGTAGDITVDGANWTSQGISLISTGGSVSFLNNASSFGGTVSVQSSDSITQDVALTSSGNASFASDNDIILENAGNEFSGELNATATDATSTISIVNGFTGTMTLGEIATPGDFTLVASGNVDSADDSAFEIGGSTTVTIDGASNTLVSLVSHGSETTSFGGLVTIGVSNSATIDTVELGGNGLITASITTGQTGTLGLSALGEDVDVDVDTDVELDVVDLTGDLMLDASGSISQDATGTLAIDGTATFTADATGTIIVDNASNDFTDVVVLQGAEVGLADTNSITLTLPGDTPLSLSAASATVSSAGNLTDGASGVIDVGDLVVTTTGSVIFDNTSNDFGSVSATGSVVSLYDSAGGIDLAGVSTTGNFTLTTADAGDAGDVTQSGPLLIGGTTTITADGGDGDITLDDFSNNFVGPVNLTGDVVYIVTTGTLTLSSIDASEFSFSAPSFTFDANTFDGVTGTLTFVAQPGRDFLIGENHYLLTDGTDTFGIDPASTTYISNAQIDILEGEVQLTGVGFETAGAIYVDGLVTTLDVFLTASGAVQFIDALSGSQAASVFLGDLTVNAGGAISQFNLVDDPDTYVDNWLIGGTFGVFDPAFDFPILDNLTANVTVNGFATFNSSSTVTLTNAGNNFGTSFDAVSGSGTSFAITDANFIALGEITSTGNVTIVAGSTIFINDAITSGGSIVLTTGDGIVDNAVLADEAIAATGSLTINATNSVILDITGVQIGTTTTVNAGSTVVMSDVDNDFVGSVTVTGTSLTLTDANGVTFGNVTLGDTLGTNTFNVTANADGVSTGSVTVTGVLDSAEVTVNAGGGNVTATNAGNDIDGNVTVTANNLSLANTGGVSFGTTNLTGNLILTAGGFVQDVGDLNVSGTTSITAIGQGVWLNNDNTDFDGAVSISAGYIWLNDADDLTLGAITQTDSGLYTYVTAGGPVTGSQKIDAAGFLYINSSGASGSINLTGEVDVGEVGFENDTTFIATNDITVNNALNDFDGEVVVSGANVTLRDANSIFFGPSIYLGGSSVSGNLLVTAGGAVADNAATQIDVSGTTTINATSSVTLDNSNDFGGAVAVDAGGAVSLRDVNDILLGDIDATGQSLTVVANTSNGITDGASSAISQASGTSVLAAAASFTAGAGADIDLSESGNNFTGAVTIVSANDASITDANSLTLGAVSLFDVGADTGDLTIVADGVTGASELNIAGVTDINSAGADVSLSNVANTFGGAVEIESRDATIAFDASGIEFGASTITRTFTVNALGDVDQSGAITGGSSLTVNVNAAGVDINLLHNTPPDDDFANDFSYFAVGGAFPANSIALRDAVGDIDFGTLDVLTDFSLEVVGDINSNQVIDVDGNTYIQVTGATSSVSLTNTGNTFGVNTSHSLTIIASSDVTVYGTAATGDVNIEGADVDVDIDSIGGVVNVDGDNTTISTGGAIMLGALDINGDLDIDANTGGSLAPGVVAISQTADGIDVSGTTTLAAGGADIDLLNGDLFSDLFAFATPDQANSFGGGVTISDAFNIFLGTSSDLIINSAVSTSLDTEYAQIVVLAPDLDINGAVKAPYVYFWSSGGGTEVGLGAAGAGMSLTQTDLSHVDASQYLLIGEAANVEVKSLSLSGAKLGDLNSTLGLVIYADGNVAITGEVTSPDALDFYVGPADNIYITGKLGVAGHDTLLPLGDVYLIADNDVLIGGDLFVAQTDPAALDLFESVLSTGDVDRLNDVVIHNVDNPLAPARFTIIAEGNVAMQTTVQSDNPDELKGLQVGTLALIGSPEYINLFGSVVFGGQVVTGVDAALIVDNPPSSIPFSVDYEFNGCVINSPQCSGINQRPTTRPPDEDLYLDLALDPEEEEDDDPFTNRGNEEEWR